MASKIKILTVNIDKEDAVALALRDMQDMVDVGWSIVGQSQYQNAVTYTLLLLEGRQTLKVDTSSSAVTGVDARVKVEIPAQSIELGSGPVLH